MDGLTEIGQIIGPIGVLVVVAKLDALRYDMTEIKTDARKLRASLVHHLEDHAH